MNWQRQIGEIQNKIYIHIHATLVHHGNLQGNWSENNVVNGSGKKIARIGGFAYPYSPPSSRFRSWSGFSVGSVCWVEHQKLKHHQQKLYVCF